MMDDPNYLLDKLKNFIDGEFHGSKESFAKWLGLPGSTIRAMFSQETWPSVKIFMIMKGKNQLINLGYFFSDESSYFIDDSRKNDLESMSPRERKEALKQQFIQGQTALAELITSERPQGL